MPRRKDAKLTSEAENYSAKSLNMETLLTYLIGYDENHLNAVYIQEITDSKPKRESYQAKSAELRQKVRSKLAELKGVDPKSILYPRSNVLLSEYNNEIQRLELEKLAKVFNEQEENSPNDNLKKYEIKDNSKTKTITQTANKLRDNNKEQTQFELINVKTVDSDSNKTTHSRSNVQLSEYDDEIQHLELEKLSKEFKEQEENLPNDNLKKYEIEDKSKIKTITQEDHKFNDDNEEQNQRKLSDVKTVDSTDSNKETHCEQIIEKSNVKTKQIRKDYSVSRSDLAIVDISYRDDKEGKAAFWDHYTFQRITSYPTRVVGTTDDASFLKEQIKDKTYGLPVSLDESPYKPTPPIIGPYPYSPNDLHGLLLIPGSHSDSDKCPNYEERMKNEESLLKDAWNRGRPVLGICDGGLKIWKLFGGKEVKVHNHASRMMPYLTKNGRVGHNTAMHHLRINLGSTLAGAMYGKEADKVAATYPVANSVHSKAMSPKIVPPNMEVVARSIKRADKAPSNRSPEENVIEAAETCHGAPMLLIQWHPEAFNSDDVDGKYHRSILTYMAKAGDTYYRKQEMLLELKKLCQSPEDLLKNIRRQTKEYQKTSERASEEKRKSIVVDEVSE